MNIQYLISIAIYMAAVIAIGVWCSKKANKDPEAYFIGGRTLGPWVSAMSAEASDMSGWLLMGLPVLHTGAVLLMRAGLQSVSRSVLISTG